MKYKKYAVRKRWKCSRGIALLLFAGYVCFLLQQGAEENGTLAYRMCLEIENRLQYYVTRQFMPGITYAASQNQEQTLSDLVIHKMVQQLPVISYTNRQISYDTSVESTLTYEEIITLEGQDEPEVIESQMLMAAEQENIGSVAQAAELENARSEQPAAQPAGSVSAASSGLVQPSVLSTQPVVTIPMEKLADFDFLVQNFYQVDNSTTVDSSILNAQELMNKDLTIQTGADAPQILIYHTHSQELFADSNPEDVMTGIMGTGEYLTKLLQEEYGFHVLHHMGQYDVGDRDHAYSKAEPAIEQLLAENPSIEVVIDLHRDSVNKHLVREVNGMQMAPVMFFNGLSRSKELGAISYLNNPNLSGNLAFSLQMQVAAAEYYPDLTRPIYLKCYRYNMHFREKNLLVEVGSHMNTMQEAQNAMIPLADLLDKILHGKM